MRKVIYSAAVSLDGFIAGPGEAIDWLRWSDDSKPIMAELWKGVDAILFGRKTWEFALRSGGGGGGGSTKMKSYVFSRTLDAAKGAELVRDDAVGFVGALKSQPGGAIFLMGGGELASTLIAGGVVDEIVLGVHPLLLGGGVPMFPAIGRRVELALIGARPIAADCVHLRYAAKP